MKIEILFNDFCNQYGDNGNVLYLQKFIDYLNEINFENKKHEIIYTEIKDEMRFLDEKIDLVYMGSLSETKMEEVIQKFKSNKDKFISKLEENQAMIITGNAFDIFRKIHYKR